jgi:GST-like protein
MIDLYYWPTPNGWKVTILFEELGLSYNAIPIDIMKGDQFAPEFLEISPNNRVPAVVDTEGEDGAPLSIFESGAILLHYAEKHRRFIPANERGRAEVLQWLFFQMGNVGPMLGQCHHFRNYALEKIPYAIDRYVNEARRLFRVVEKRLADRDFVAGDYSIADMALFPWMRNWKNQGQDIAEFPAVGGWLDRMNARLAVQRGLAVRAEDERRVHDYDEEERSVLWGARQYGQH